MKDRKLRQKIRRDIRYRTEDTGQKFETEDTEIQSRENDLKTRE